MSVWMILDDGLEMNNWLGAVHLSHDTRRGRGSQAKYHPLSLCVTYLNTCIRLNAFDRMRNILGLGEISL